MSSGPHHDGETVARVLPAQRLVALGCFGALVDRVSRLQASTDFCEPFRYDRRFIRRGLAWQPSVPVTRCPVGLHRPGCWASEANHAHEGLLNPGKLCTAKLRSLLWLEPGHRVVVESLPSRLGPVSMSVEAKQGLVEVECSVPTGAASHQTYLDIRLPRGTPIDEMLDSDTPVDGVDQGYRVRLKPEFTGPMKMVFSTRTSTE